MPLSDGLEASIQPENIFFSGSSGRRSTICRNAVVSGVSVIGVE
jgi:hypothetical protein